VTYLVDTDVLIDFLAERPQAVQLFDAIANTGIAISVITLGEFYEGIYRSSRGAAEMRFLSLVDDIQVLEASALIMKRYAWIRATLHNSGRLIPDFDIIIGATCIVHDLTLVTRNRKHFERIEGLKLYEFDQTSV
jgi:tRNA(fMet)-specific endonuclease VapC